MTVFTIKEFIKNIYQGIHHLSFGFGAKVRRLSPILALAFQLMVSSCNVNQFLSKDQFIVAKNQVKITDIEKKSTRKALQLELATLYKQKGLSEFLVWQNKSGVWYYFKGLQNKNPSKFQRWKYNNFAKKPAFFDESLTASTVQNMKQYLINKGYRNPSVYSEKNFRGKEKGLADITYYVKAGQLFVLDTVNFICADTTIQFLLNDTRDKSFLQKGAPLSASRYEQERQRITETLNNAGYARFTPNYISQITADTVETGFDEKGNRKVNVELTVQLPSPKTTHLKFSTSEVIIYPNYDARIGETIAKDTIVDGKVFFTYDGKLGIKPRSLSDAVKINAGEIYKKENVDKTFRQLTTLGVYKFINIKPNIEECDSTLITYKVYLTPSKKMSFEAGAEVNYSNISGSLTPGNIGRFGVALDLGFVHKNFLGGAERFSSNLSGGVDIGLTINNGVQNGLSTDLRFDNALSIPKFINFSKSWKVFNKLGIIRDRFYTELKEQASSDYSLNYVLSDRLSLDLYRLQQLNLGFKYVLKRNNGLERVTINQTGIELNFGRLTPNFDARINERTRRSFDNQVLTGFAFRSLVYEKNIKSNVIGEQWKYTASFEQSGSELWLADNILNKGNPLSISDNLPFSKFWRGEFDIRFSKQLTEKQGLAMRIGVGIGSPFANAKAVPFSRQFFVGGPNSIRGWVARDLGPGGYINPQRDFTLPFQTGDMKIELNSEYRFPLFWRLKSAIFLDAGNVWTLKADEKLPDGNIDKFWFDQIAVSTGLGMRLDVTYALIRLDFGFRLRNPYSTNGRNWIPVDEYGWRNNVNLNFALGLPF